MHFPDKILKIKKNQKEKHILDVDLLVTKEIRELNSFECHIILYPYSRKINSDHINFFPFEEYVKDIHSGFPSAYYILEKSFKKFFGFFLGILIFAIFIYFKPSDLFSVQSIVTIFAAYSIGKELWDDIEKAIINFTKKMPVRFVESYYKYKLEKQSTLTNYSNLARKTRYGKSSLMPQDIHFLQLSNSQTIRMKFDREELENFNGEGAHILSIHIDKNLISEFEKFGYLMGIKISMNKKKWFHTHHFEAFQSIHNSVVGCLDDDNLWKNNSFYYRIVNSLGRFRYVKETGVIAGKPILEIDSPVQRKFKKSS